MTEQNELIEQKDIPVPFDNEDIDFLTEVLCEVGELPWTETKEFVKSELKNINWE